MKLGLRTNAVGGGGFTLRVINAKAEIAGPPVMWLAQYAVIHVQQQTGHVSGGLVYSPKLMIDQPWIETQTMYDQEYLYAMMTGIIFYDANGEHTSGPPLPISALREPWSPVWGKRLRPGGEYVFDGDTNSWIIVQEPGTPPAPGPGTHPPQPGEPEPPVDEEPTKSRTGLLVLSGIAVLALLALASRDRK